LRLCPILSLAAAMLMPLPASALDLTEHRLALTDDAGAGGVSVTINQAGGGAIRVSHGASGYVAQRAKPAAHAARPAGALPDTEVTVGTGDIRKVWLSGPTRRYDHGVLGDAIEADSVSAELAGGTIVTFAAGADAVFEDRIPRLVDIDGNGRTEIMLVRSHLNFGAALVLVGPIGGKLALLAEAAPIGTAHRWLNPVGVADFDGDCVNEAAVVITPHIGGALQLYEWRGDRLVPDHAAGAEVGGFSNHPIGSRELGLSALADLDRDGTIDIMVPAAGRRALVGVSFAGGRYRELFRHSLPSAIDSSIAVRDLDADGRAEIVFGLHDGTVRVLTARP
jgi:hypothetical protein